MEKQALKKREKQQAVHIGEALLPAAHSGTQAVCCYGVPVADLAGFTLCVRSGSSTNSWPSSRTPVCLTEANNALSSSATLPPTSFNFTYPFAPSLHGKSQGAGVIVPIVTIMKLRHRTIQVRVICQQLISDSHVRVDLCLWFW